MSKSHLPPNLRWALMENGVPVDVGKMRSHRKEGGPIRRAWRPDQRGASGHRHARGRGARHWPVCDAAASRGARGRREARGAPVPAPSRGAAHVPPPGHGTTHPRRLSHPACGARAGGPSEDAPVARGAAGSAGGSLALPVCGRDSPSARGGATSQLVTSEAHVQRRGPAAGDRAGGGRRGCPSEATSARVPMSRPPARLQTRGAPSPSSSVAGCSPLGGRLEAPPQRHPAQREPRLPQLPAGYGERAGGGGRLPQPEPGFTGLRGGAQRRDQQLGSGNAARLHVSGAATM